MNFILAQAFVWHLVIMPTVTPKVIPFVLPGTYTTEDACKADAAANLSTYLTQHGLPGGTANFACTVN